MHFRAREGDLAVLTDVASGQGHDLGLLDFRLEFRASGVFGAFDFESLSLAPAAVLGRCAVVATR